ncbi:MAG TPA: hypothetical protein PKO22_05195 [Treponemataceae bacterium]|nr:hypothetical protein [Treponemataceae bacterium]
MPWKLVSFLSVLVVITLFIGFNLENRCDVSLIVYTYKNVPIFVSLLFAYVVGALTTIPFFLASGTKRRNSKKPAAKKGRTSIPSPDENPDYDID